jgi:hypothetical protein
MKPPILMLLLGLMLSCNQNKSVTQSPDASFDYSKVLVLLQEGISPKKFISSLPDYKLTHHGPSSRTQNQHTFYLGIENADPKACIKAIRNLDFVVEADYLSTPN